MKNNNRTLNLLLISLLLFSAINTFASNPTEDGFDAQAVDDDSIYLKLFPPVAIRTPEEGPGADMDIPQNGTSPMKAPFYGTTVPKTFTVDKSKSVGEIPIVSGTSISGAKTYSIPINIPNGLSETATPTISIEYNSQAGNGIVGIGWSITGLSQISRQNKSIYYDGKVESVSYENDDAFVLDGMRLIKLESTASYNVYQTEQGNVKAKGYISTYGISYFEVFYPNGGKGTFGSPSETESNGKSSYPIMTLSDIHGNKINYSYNTFDGIYMVSRIQYSNVSVDFNYRDVSGDKVYYYIGGRKFGANKLLSSVKCSAGTNEIGTYTFEYDESPNEMYRNIAFLREVGYSSKGQALNPLKFYYGYRSVVGENNSTEILPGNWYETDNENRLVKQRCRFDYHGVSDALICYPYNVSYWLKKVTLLNSKFENKYSGNEPIYIYTDLSGNGSQKIYQSEITTGQGFVELLTANLTGDLEENIIKVNNTVDSENNREKLTFTVYEYSSTYGGIKERYTRTFYLNTLLAGAMNSKAVNPKYYRTGDFDGDGRMEILAVSAHKAYSESTTYSTKCYIFDLESNQLKYGSPLFEYEVSFLGTSNQDSNKASNETDKIFIVDYDGDGKHDIMHINNSGTYIYSFNLDGSSWSAKKTGGLGEIKRELMADHALMPCDVNADGLTDILVSPKNDNKATDWTIYRSKGDGSFQKTILTGVVNNGNDTASGFFLFDADGDGVSDLVKYDSYGIYCYKNNRHFYDFEETFPMSGMPIDWANSYSWIPANVNSTNSYSWIFALRDNVIHKKSFKLNTKLQSLCIGMINSYGVIEHNEYAMMNDRTSGICTASNSKSFPYVNFLEPLPLIFKTTVYNKGNEISWDMSTYMSPVVHIQGLGFQGFGQIEKQNKRGQRFIRTFDTANRGVPKSEVNPTQEVTHDYSILSDSKGLVRVLENSRIEKNLLDGTTATYTMAYDQYGNMTSNAVSFGDSKSKTTSYTYSNNTALSNGYYVGFPVKTVETTIYGSKTSAVTTEVTSHSKCQPLTIKIFKNNVLVKTQDFTYDAKGLKTKESIKNYSSSKLATTQYQYDNYGRNTKITDKFGAQEWRTYTDAGLVKSKTDSRGCPTEYTYDSFGREIKRLTEDWDADIVDYAWCGDSENGLYKQVVTEHTGASSIKIFDAFGNEVREGTLGPDNSVYYVDRQYDNYGNLKKESLPYKSGSSPSMWTSYSYDGYDRVLSKDMPSGKSDTFSYGSLNRTSVENGVSSTTYYDEFGGVIKIKDPSGTVTYELDADGQPLKIVAPGNISTVFEYDTSGRLVKITDPSHGTLSKSYDADGNLASVTNARGQTITYTYDSFNRKTKTTTPEMSLTYRYSANNDDVIEEKSSDGFYRHRTYNKHGQVERLTDSIEGKSISKVVSYNKNGLVSAIAYSTSLKMEKTELREYANGHLISVKLNDGTDVYKYVASNSMGLVSEISSGGMTTYYTYDEYGILTRRKDMWGNGVLSDVSLDFDPYNGNLLSRTDNKRGITERFEYDGLNRLTDYGDNHVTYASNGNITVKSDAGAFAYSNTSKPYALTHAVFADPDIPTRDQSITYASFMRPLTLSENDYGATFTYGPDFDRVKMVLDHYSSWSLMRYYLGGNYELDNNCVMPIAKPTNPLDSLKPLPGIPIDSYGTDGLKDPPNPGIGEEKRDDFYDVERIYIGGDAYTAHAVLVKSTKGSGSVTLYRIVRDQVGSIVALVGDGGKVVEENSYDAWGRMRDPDTHEVYRMDKVPGLTLGRGYGSHEYLYRFGLVNMNARLYDPVLGRFASPDPYVQDPTLPQNFNRYSYCLNNPLLYRDPSGEFFMTILTSAIELWSNVFTHGFNVNRYNWKRTENAWAIDTGMFRGNFGQVLQKMTWGILTTGLGNITAHGLNLLGKIDHVSYMDGMLALSGVTSGDQAFTIGYYSFGPKNYNATWMDHLFVHEYGHYIQSQFMGPLFLPVVALPSVLSAWKGTELFGIEHIRRWFEVNASHLGSRHFDHYYGRGKSGYNKNSEKYFDIESFRTGRLSKYVNPRTKERNGHKYFTNSPKFTFWDLLIII